MVSLEAISGLGNQKKSLLINELVALGDSHRPLQLPSKALTSFRALLFLRLLSRMALASVPRPAPAHSIQITAIAAFA